MTDDLTAALESSGTRRGMMRLAFGGLMLTTGGLAVPLSAAATSQAVQSDTRGGQRRKRRRGHKRHSGIFRDCAAHVINKDSKPLECVFYYQVETGVNTYGSPL